MVLSNKDGDYLSLSSSFFQLGKYTSKAKSSTEKSYNFEFDDIQWLILNIKNELNKKKYLELFSRPKP